MAYYAAEITSPLSPQEVHGLLRTLIRPRRTFMERLETMGEETGVAEFEGTVDGDRFRATRMIGYRNSFLPVIHGQVRTRGSGSVITLTMRLHISVMIFMVIWLGGVGTIAASTSALIPLGMFLVGIALPAVGFYPEAFKARDILRRKLVAT
jgi:hypothetical protein